VINQWVNNDLQEDWDVTSLDTGLETMTGGRLKKCIEYVGRERIFATYGDGLGNIDLNKLLEFHEKMNCASTITAVRPPSRFGVLESENGIVTKFGEKNQADSGWINGGFFVLEPEVLDFINSEKDAFEAVSLPALAHSSKLAAYHHEGFWQPMDTLREKIILSKFAAEKNPPWLRFI
jgi:glucose-1-phosphate cytidylyltransferase